MAESLIADLLKTPGQVRREQLDKLNKQGATSAQTMLTGTRFGSPIGGALQSLAGVGMEMMPAMTSQMFRGATGLLGGIAGAAGARPEVVEAIQQAQYSPEERRAAELAEFAKEGVSTDPKGLRLLSAKLMEMGQPDAAIKVEEQASRIEKLQAEAIKAARDTSKFKMFDEKTGLFLNSLLKEKFKEAKVNRDVTSEDILKFWQGSKQGADLQGGYEAVFPKSNLNVSGRGTTEFTVDKEPVPKEVMDFLKKQEEEQAIDPGASPLL